MIGNSLMDTMPPSVRERLLVSAAAIFAQKGYAAATVREIVEAAGVTKPALYYYFRNKEGIYLELMREAQAKLETLLDIFRLEGGQACARIAKLCDRLLVLLEENIQVARVIYAVYYGPPQGSPAFDFDVFHFRFRETLRELIREGIEAGELRPEDMSDMAWAIIGAVNIAIEVELCHPDLSLGREGLARVLELIFLGLRIGYA